MTADRAHRGSATLRPRARIVRIIGKDLISNEVVALVELIKNAYDADANHVRIVFEEPLRPSEGGILIEDDGVGMTLQTVKSAWFEPATVSKTKETRSASGRRMTGEKGIGRFAAARLARTLEMTTVSKVRTRRPVQVRFDWGAFEDESSYLDEVRVQWEELPVVKGRKPGTALHLKGLNDHWDMPKFGRLRGELSRLVSPKSGKGTFRIDLQLPDRFREYAGPVSQAAILEKPHYRIRGRVDAGGEFKATYTGPEMTKEAVSGRIALESGRQPTCGAFQFEFRVWDRDREGLERLTLELKSTLKNLRDDLDSACGISIYRDNFRVLLPDSDWLRLDIRRVQNPTMRLSNNQVVGRVFISAEDNKGLRDQTNREGLVSAQEVEDFKKAIVELLSTLEVKRDNYRGKYRRATPSESLFKELDLSPVREFLEQRYPEDKEVQDLLAQKTRTLRHGVEKVQQVLARYRRLATLGQLIDVVLHEGRTPVTTISNEIDLCRKDLSRKEGTDIDVEGFTERLDRISRQTRVLTGLFRRLAPFGGRKRGRPQRLSIENVIDDALELHAKAIADLGVDVQRPKAKTMVTVDEAEMQQIFVNLVDNALYWLEKVPKENRRIAIEVSRQDGQLVVIFSDSGPGVPDDIRDRIFDPYFSSKPNGVGLGLTIAGETAAEYDGNLELIAGGPLSGATFRIILRRRIGEHDGL
jgi:signal transduction histidine kinase